MSLNAVCYNITCPTKNFGNSTIFIFILVGVFCEFAMAPSVYILLSRQKGEVHSTS